MDFVNLFSNLKKIINYDFLHEYKLKIIKFCKRLIFSSIQFNDILDTIYIFGAKYFQIKLNYAFIRNYTLLFFHTK